MRAYEEATQYDGQWYKACHSWAMFNFEVTTCPPSNQDQASLYQHV
jgi:hypothetical protein